MEPPEAWAVGVGRLAEEMVDLFGQWGTRTGPDVALLTLGAAIGVLFIVIVACSVYAVALRVGHDMREKRWTRLTARWQEPLLTALSDPAQVAAVHALVEERYRLHFVRFVLEYTRRVRGEERQTLRKLAMPYLGGIAALADDPRSEIRTRAIQTLGTLGLPKYSKEVVKGLDDPSPLVSMVAARCLAREEFPEFAPQILSHLGRFDGWNRRYLSSMLAAMGSGISEMLRDGLADEDAPNWVRAVLADALQMQLDPLAGDVAAKAIVTSEDRDLLASLLRLLAVVGRQAHTTVIRARCASPDAVIRAQALHALGLLGDEDDLPLLVRSMGDTSPWAALHAARGVREAGGRALLADLAESDDPKAALAGQVLSEEDDS